MKFPHDLVFQDMLKEGDSAEMATFLKRPSVDPQSIINTQGNQEGPALHKLVQDGNLKCVRILVNLGADVNMQDEHGWTPLHYCVFAGNMAIMRFLLKHGANPDISDFEGRQAVDFTDDFDFVELLIRYSKDERRKSMLPSK